MSLRKGKLVKKAEKKIVKKEVVKNIESKNVISNPNETLAYTE